MAGLHGTAGERPLPRLQPLLPLRQPQPAEPPLPAPVRIRLARPQRLRRPGAPAGPLSARRRRAALTPPRARPRLRRLRPGLGGRKEVEVLELELGPGRGLQ